MSSATEDKLFDESENLEAFEIDDPFEDPEENESLLRKVRICLKTDKFVKKWIMENLAITKWLIRFH